MASAPDTPPKPPRRPRYSGTHPRAFADKYKERAPERYSEDVQKVLAAGKTPAGSHRPIMVDEIVAALAPAPGQIAVDATLGGGGHTRALLARVRPGGRVIGLDVDPIELARTEERLRLEGVEAETFAAHRSNFAGLPKILGREGLVCVDMILADLGVSSMQLDDPARGFTHKGSSPLDMRMNPARGVPASARLSTMDEETLRELLIENADEPHAETIAQHIVRDRPETSDALRRSVASGMGARAVVDQREIDLSIRRTFQAIRIFVNDEFGALDALLRHLPLCLAPGGRVAILTFHSGEDRRVKKSFQAGERDGTYAVVADEPVRPALAEVRANPRASSAKLRWAIRAMP